MTIEGFARNVASAEKHIESIIRIKKPFVISKIVLPTAFIGYIIGTDGKVKISFLKNKNFLSRHSNESSQRHAVI